MPPDSVLVNETTINADTIPATSSDSIPKFRKAAAAKKKNRFTAGLKKSLKATGAFFNFKKDYPSPKKALILTAILPGTGQIYNKKYWKLPIVYGAVGSMVYFISFTRGQYRRYRTAYIYRLDDDDNTIDEFTVNGQELLGTSAIKSRRDLFRKRNELSYVGLAFSYILAGVDAFVDAHLMRFDVSDDLSLQWQPTYEFLPNKEGAMGLHLSLQQKSKSNIVYPVEF